MSNGQEKRRRNFTLSPVQDGKLTVLAQRRAVMSGGRPNRSETVGQLIMKEKVR